MWSLESRVYLSPRNTASGFGSVLFHHGHSLDHSDVVPSFEPKELGSVPSGVGGVYKFYSYQLKSGLKHPGCHVLTLSTSSSCCPLAP